MTDISRDDVLAMLADELEAAQGQLERLGMALLAEPGLARTYIREFQSLDHVSQRCGSIAAILRSNDIHAATYAATLESIAGRLHRDPARSPRQVAENDTNGEIEWYN